MELSFTGAFATQLFEKSKRDGKLAQAMAKEFLGSIEPAHMAEFLLKPEIAVALLAARLQRDPRGTIQQLQRLPKAQPATPRGRPRRPAEGTTTAAKRPLARRPAGGKQTRRRLTATQVAELKQQVRAYLARNPWATRKELTARIDLPTQAIYRRIMVELQDSGEVVARGQKAKATYALATKQKALATKQKALASKKKTKARKVVRKAATKATRKKRTPALCPVPGCSNVGAPIFGMLCKEHKDIAPEERMKLFAARRQKR